MRLGVFGGSFDPIHVGHLILAETCREAAGLDQVWFIPTARPPHKPRQLSEGKDRLAMIELAIAGHANFQASDLELQREGISFTVDTLEAMAREHPGAELFLILGADSLADLAGWRQPRRILELATPLVAQRPGATADLDHIAALVSPARLAAIGDSHVDMPAIDISSTELRQRVAQGRSIRYRTSSAVEHYIRHRGLYHAVAKEKT